VSSAARVVELWRYPVKSMGGERCAGVDVDTHGIVGDRSYALVDALTGKVASAKNPRLWSSLLRFRARYLQPPGRNGHTAPVEITLPSGELRSSDDPSLDADLSSGLGRAVRLSKSAPAAPTLEEYWPDLEELAHRDEVTDEAMPTHTFFDCATVHVLTTNTLAALGARYPDGNFDAGRFRPNLLLTADDGDFIEDAWIGSRVQVGNVVLRVTGPAPRCVMTTLPHDGLPPDLGVLRTAARHHNAHVGIYAEVERGGTIAAGDTLEPLS
jgi:uncharacterized protein YcbX